MKLIFCLLPEPGHVHPYIGPAQALAQMGHDVSVVAQGDLTKQMEKCGLSFNRGLLPPSPPPHFYGEELVELMQNRERQAFVIEKYFFDSIEGQVPDVLSFLKSEKPDGLIIDPMNYSLIIAAHLLKVPWVSMSSSLTSVLSPEIKSDVLEILELLEDRRAEIFRKFNFDAKFRAIDCLSPYLNISFATSAFVGSPPSEVNLVGPSRPLFSRGDEVAVRSLSVEKKIVYVSFGSQLFHFPEVYKKMIAACEALNVQLILSVGDLADELKNQESENLQIYNYAPQVEILKKAALFITHGGANSVMEGISAGVPLLVNPICNDQFHQAFFVERANIGRVLNLSRASVTEIRKMMAGLLADIEIQTAMTKVSATYQENGALEAARLISETLKAC